MLRVYVVVALAHGLLNVIGPCRCARSTRVQQGYHSSAGASTSAEVQEDEMDEEAIGGLTVDNVDTLSHTVLGRQCFEKKAERFTRLMAKYGYASLPDIGNTHPLVELVVVKWTISDLKENYLASYNKLRALIAKWHNKDVREWDEELRNVSQKIDDLGFNYDGVVKQCDNGGLAAQECVLEAAGALGAPLLAMVAESLEIDDLMVHQPEIGRGAMAEALHKKISAASFDVKKELSACAKTAKRNSAALVEQLLGQFRDPIGEGGVCMENLTKGFCPEGTAPRIARGLRPVLATAAAGIAYGVSMPIMFLLASGVGFMVGGPLGAAAGAGVALTAPYAAPTAALTYAIFVRGPRRCMCFPRECVYDVVEKSCAIGSHEDAAYSANPYGRSLPLLSHKCVPRHGQEEACELLPCTEQDHQHALGGVYGTIGKHSGGTYNCLSRTGSSAGSLLVEGELPGLARVPNTPAHRNELFETLGVAPKTDPRENATRRCCCKGAETPQCRMLEGPELRRSRNLTKFRSLVCPHTFGYQHYSRSRITATPPGCEDAPSQVEVPLQLVEDASHRCCCKGPVPAECRLLGDDELSRSWNFRRLAVSVCPARQGYHHYLKYNMTEIPEACGADS